MVDLGQVRVWVLREKGGCDYCSSPGTSRGLWKNVIHSVTSGKSLNLSVPVS